MCRSHELVRESEKHYKEIIQVLEVSKLRYYLMSNLLHSSSDCVCVFQHIGIQYNDCCVCVSLVVYCNCIYDCCVCVSLVVCRKTSGTWYWSVWRRRERGSWRISCTTCTARDHHLPPLPQTPRKDSANNSRPLNSLFVVHTHSNVYILSIPRLAPGLYCIYILKWC